MTATVRKRRVVVADDSKFWREKIATVLSRSGHEVIAVRDGVSAIRLCLDPARPVDLAIVDLVMPGVDGFEVARYLRAERMTEKLPIIGMTSLFKAEDFPDGPQGQGFVAILEKSVSPDQFMFVFNKYLHAPLSQRRPAPRVPTHLSAEYRYQAGKTGRCVIANLSATGAFLSALSPLEPGTEISLTFTLPEGPAIRTSALVIWLNENRLVVKGTYSRGMGVLFKKMQRDLQTALEKYIAAELTRL